MDELYEQLDGQAPDAIVCSVGGGGLLNGILLGLDKHNWNDTTILAMETYGADSMNASLRSKKVVTLPKITSIAKSLGVSRISNKTWDLIHERNATRTNAKGKVHSIVLDDAEAAMACVRFADEEDVIIEPACGVSVVGAYNGLFESVVPGFGQESRIVVVVCGGKSFAFCGALCVTMLTGSGSTVNMKNLVEFEKEFQGQVSW